MKVQAERNFRNNLKAVMEARDLSQRRVATMAETTQPFLNRIITGHSVPTLELADRVSQSLGFSLADMVSDPGTFSGKIDEELAARS